MSAIDTSYVVGLMLGPSLGGFLFDQVGTYLPFLVFGCFSFLLLIFSLLLRRKIHESSTESENDHVDNTSSSSSCQSFLRMLTLPAMLVSMFGLMVTSSGWDWYQSSIATFLEQEYSLSASQIGLVLVSSGLTYIITSPICGYILGRTNVTLWIHIIGLLIIFTGYLLFGPIPQLKHIASIPLTAAALSLQGVGFSMSYIGMRKKSSLHYHDNFQF